MFGLNCVTRLFMSNWKQLFTIFTSLVKLGPVLVGEFGSLDIVWAQGLIIDKGPLYKNLNIFLISDI